MVFRDNKTCLWENIIPIVKINSEGMNGEIFALLSATYSFLPSDPKYRSWFRFIKKEAEYHDITLEQYAEWIGYLYTLVHLYDYTNSYKRKFIKMKKKEFLQIDVVTHSKNV